MQSPSLTGLKDALELTDEEITDSSLAGHLKRIERLEEFAWCVDELLTIERRAYLLSHANRSAFHAN